MPKFLDHIKGGTLILLGLLMPVSVFATDVLVGIIALLWLVEGGFSLKWQVLKASKWVIALLGLMAFYFLGMLWGQDHGGATWLLEKMSLLLLLPILLSFNLSQKQWRNGFIAFVFSVFLSAILALLINIKAIPYLFKVFPFITKNWGLAAFMPYTYHNVYLAITILLLAFVLAQSKAKSWKIGVGLALVLSTMLLSLFTENGRAGQLAFLVLSSVSLVYFFRKKKGYLILSFVLLGMGVGCAYQYSSVFNKRINRTVQEFNNSAPKSSNSIDSRYTMLFNSWELIEEKPLHGYGTGSFVETFAKVNEQTAQLVSGHHKTPHNNYLFVWFELGLLGLIVFLSIFYFQLKEFYALPFGFGRCLLPLFFLLIMFSDAYFYNHNSAVLYAFLSAFLARYSV